MVGEHTIHAIAIHRGEWWVAQCLEYDIATQAPEWGNNEISKPFDQRHP